MQPNYRRCASCRKVAPKEEFLRIVRVYPNREIRLDQGMGRSAYLCPHPDCLQAAQKKNRLGRALKAAIPEEIYQMLWQRLSSSGQRHAQDSASWH
ncbi:YlxR family protein [Pseudanabaena sp. FACHB-2040]|uniref:YlxR family protein n=1 Tax=Pseudanabaena sp. FACHB-2040 TaxID=2692859 RepID=UPI0016879FE5|nr:YlxR family protein [Pseudanabaena sp. FACHB-2040]MBD2260822.1 YlxR family protein [Pseudanabaena sp. FACHB-2040]